MKDPASARLRPIKDPLVGTTVDGRYAILAAIGLGATSTVYKAEDKLHRRTVAIKLLHPHLAFDEGLVSRFEREAQAAKILTHPNIVAVSEYAISDSGTPYLIMDYIEGLSLQQLLARDSWLPVSVAIPIFTQICTGLNEAHQKGIVHRDIKPGNIMLLDRPDGDYFVKILDFGCAQMVPMLGDTVLKATQTGEMLGSLLYMSPEQCLDEEVDGRSDCYSLGCMLYETLTGKPPLAARTAFETMNKQLSTMPDSLQHARPDLALSKDLERIIFKAVAKQPAKRYQKITDFMDDLLKVSDQKSPRHLLADYDNQHDAGAGRYAPVATFERTLNDGKLEFSARSSAQEQIAGGDQGPAKQEPFKTTLRAVGIATALAMSCATLCIVTSPPYFILSLFILYFAVVIALIFKPLMQTKASQQYDTIRKGEPQILRLQSQVSPPQLEALLKMESALPFIPALMTRTEVKIYTAERQKDRTIDLEIADSSLVRQRVTIRPIESHSPYWRSFTGDESDTPQPIEFPVAATLIQIEEKKISYLVVKDHLSVILR